MIILVQEMGIVSVCLFSCCNSVFTSPAACSRCFFILCEFLRFTPETSLILVDSFLLSRYVSSRIKLFVARDLCSKLHATRMYHGVRIHIRTHVCTHEHAAINNLFLFGCPCLRLTWPNSPQTCNLSLVWVGISIKTENRLRNWISDIQKDSRHMYVCTYTRDVTKIHENLCIVLFSRFHCPYVLF